MLKDISLRKNWDWDLINPSKLKSLFDIFTKLWDLDHRGILRLVIKELKCKDDDSKEDASKDDNEDTTKVFEGYSSSILLVFFTVLLKRKVKYKSL